MTATFLSVLIVNLLYGLAYSNRTALTKIDTISVSRIGEVFTSTPPPCDDVLFVGFLARFQCLEEARSSSLVKSPLPPASLNGR
jgi:hypothetical protein